MKIVDALNQADGGIADAAKGNAAHIAAARLHRATASHRCGVKAMELMDARDMELLTLE